MRQFGILIVVLLLMGCTETADNNSNETDTGNGTSGTATYSDTNTNVNIVGDTGSNAGNVADTDTDTNIDTNGYGDTGESTDRDTNTDTNTDVDTGSIPDSVLKYYVTTDGNDETGDGSFDKPFLTLTRVQEAVRSDPQRGSKPIFVMVKDGTYYLNDTFVLDSRDNGTKDAPVTYRAVNEGGAVISGGKKLSLSWEIYKGQILKAQTPPGTSFDQLFINGKQQRMARYPNYTADVAQFNGYAADAFDASTAARWADPAGGFMHVMHAKLWGGYSYEITGKDADNNLEYIGGGQNNRPGDMHATMRMVENIFEELDAPGEWFHDEDTNTLYYYPESGTNMSNALVEVTQLDHILEMQGTPDNPVSYINIDGFVFRHANRTFMKTLEPLLRSDWTIYRGGAIFVNGAEDVNILNCELDQLGGNGIFVNNYNRRVTIKGCHIHDMGASGVVFVGDPGAVRNPLFQYGQRQNIADISMEAGPQTDNYPGQCVVDDCLIHGMGLVEKQSAGVQISMSKEITVRYTSIYHCSRAGINISEGTFGGHILEHLDVFDTVRETGDHGSFNSWGRDRYWKLQGTTEEDYFDISFLDCEKNIIRNSRFRCDQGWDIDLDDGSSNYEIYNNVLLAGGLKFREGYHRAAYNNIIINNGFHPHVWFSNSDDQVYHNIFMAAHAPRGAMPDGKWGDYFDDNTFLTADQRDAYTVHDIDANSNFGDPLFIDPMNGNYQVASDSPALDVGFVNFDTRDVGVQKASLRAIRKEPAFPTLKGAVTPDPAPQTTWNGALAEQLIGEAYSAYGVSADTGGVVLLTVPQGSLADEAGFQPYDVITGINGSNNIPSIEALLEKTAAGGGSPLLIEYVRDQVTNELTMNVYE